MRNKDKIKFYKLKLAKLNNKFSKFEKEKAGNNSFKDYLLDELEDVKRNTVVEFQSEIKYNIRQLEKLSVIKNKIKVGIELTKLERDFVLNYI